jgi:hypothetical protein
LFYYSNISFFRCSFNGFSQEGEPTQLWRRLLPNENTQTQGLRQLFEDIGTPSDFPVPEYRRSMTPPEPSYVIGSSEWNLSNCDERSANRPRTLPESEGH